MQVRQIPYADDDGTDGPLIIIQRLDVFGNMDVCSVFAFKDRFLVVAMTVSIDTVDTAAENVEIFQMFGYG